MFIRAFGSRIRNPAQIEVFFALDEDPDVGAVVRTGETCQVTLEQFYEMAASLPPRLARPLPDLVAGLHENAVRIAYLNLPENDYIYRFRTDKQRNRSVYLIDERARDLYHSALCETIKTAKRSKERTSAEPAILDFGPVRYILPSHFGFCLGVQNAIERAYETLNTHPDRRVFMLSELIHNPFVNDDLRDRGLLYLQSDKGEPLDHPETRQTLLELTEQRRHCQSSLPSVQPTKTNENSSKKGSRFACMTPPACWLKRSGKQPAISATTATPS